MILSSRVVGMLAGRARDPAAQGRRRVPGAALLLRSALLLLALPVAGLAQATGGKFEPAQIEAGRAQFHRTCAQCHGRNMVNAGTTVYDLRKFPLDAQERFQHSVTEGKGNMPSFKDALTPEQIAVLWAYIGSRGGKEN
jgi:cytochrome c6